MHDENVSLAAMPNYSLAAFVGLYFTFLREIVQYIFENETLK